MGGSQGWRRAASCAGAAAVLLAATARVVEPQEDGVSYNIRLGGVRGTYVRWALDGAHRRLGLAQCQDLLTDFADAEGRSLSSRLALAGVSVQEYLGLLFFHDGSARLTCRQGRAAAITSPGSRVVFICAETFRAQQRQNGTLAEFLLIHEMLHSLGLGEDPPTSLEITAQVARRCAEKPAAGTAVASSIR